MVAPAPTPCRHNALLPLSVKKATGGDDSGGIRGRVE
jgi:hypothetical protein